MNVDDKSVQIALGTIITFSNIAAATAFFTGIYNAFTSKGNTHPGILAASAALNGGICAATFFTIRECVISPVLVSTMPNTSYVRRRRALEPTASMGANCPGRPDEISWSDLRAHKLLDTSASGAAAGGLLNGWRGGRRAIVPGIATGTLVCGLLQLVFNEVGVARIKILSRLRSGSSTNPFSWSSPNTSTPKLSHPAEPIPFVERVVTSLGLHKLSDEEYLKKLKQTRDGYLIQIRKLEELKKERE